MTWTKLDQDWLDQLAAKGVSREAILVAVEALVWSNRVGIDGAIARNSLGRMTGSPDPEAAMAELVTAGEATVTDDGWQMGGAIRDQLTSEDVEELREGARVRQRRARRHRAGDHGMCNPKWCKAASRVTASKDDVTVTRESRDTGQDRTDPDQTGEERDYSSPALALRGALAGDDDESLAELLDDTLVDCTVFVGKTRVPLASAVTDFTPHDVQPAAIELCRLVADAMVRLPDSLTAEERGHVQSAWLPAPQLAAVQ